MNNPLKEIPATDEQLPSRKRAKNNIPTVTVSVCGGVAEIMRKPKGVMVEILDFDVDGVDGEDLCWELGCHRDNHVHTTWSSSDTICGWKPNRIMKKDVRKEVNNELQ